MKETAGINTTSTVSFMMDLNLSYSYIRLYYDDDINRI